MATHLFFVTLKIAKVLFYKQFYEQNRDYRIDGPE